MSKVRLTGSTSGYTELTAPASAANNTLVLPTGNGSNGNILGTDGAGNLSWVGGRMVLEAAKTATGTAVDFTGIPSWVKKITVILQGVSTNGTSLLIVQLGSGSFTTSGYLGSVTGLVTGNVSTVSYSTGFGLTNNNVASMIYHGAVRLQVISGNTWTCEGVLGRSDAACNFAIAGSIALSGTLDRLRITTVNGTDTFDAGTINLLLEG